MQSKKQLRNDIELNGNDTIILYGMCSGRFVINIYTFVRILHAYGVYAHRECKFLCDRINRK